MSKVELKFQIPSSKLKALRLAFLHCQPEKNYLHAQYFDTAHLDLQRQHLSLRQHKENKIWVQTLEAPKSSVEYIEIKTSLGRAEPSTVNLRPCQPYKKFKHLLHPVFQSNHPLIFQFKTDISSQRFLHTEKNSKIELSLDLGTISSTHQSLEIHEIKFELKDGNIHDLIQTIQPWLSKYEIWLDSQSKTVKGQALQQSFPVAAAQSQSALTLSPQADSIQALQQMVSNCLEHLLPNASAIALEQYKAEHIHQVRVAIRRLRSALKIFSSPQIAQTKIWQKQLAVLFRQLGNTRDRDALAADLLPLLKQAGSPIAELPAQETAKTQIGAIFRAAPTTGPWLQFIDFANAEQPKGQKLKKCIRKQFNKMHQRICQAESIFTEMAESEKHQVRKRVKQLRYSIEFICSLYAPSDIKQYLKVLKPLQENLGRFNDLCVAHVLFEQNIVQQPKAWFVLGWIASEQKHIQQAIQQDLQKFQQVQRFWQSK